MKVDKEEFIGKLMTQKAYATREGITPAAVNKRIKADNVNYIKIKGGTIIVDD